MLPSVSAEPACGDPLRAGHLWIRVKLGMSDNEPCGRRIRYIPGHLAAFLRFFAIPVTADTFAARSLATPVAAILGRKEGGKAF